MADLAAFNLIDAEKNKFSRNLYLYRGWEKLRYIQSFSPNPTI